MSLVLNVYCKKLKNNFFITISDNLGKSLWGRSLGCFKFKNIQKRSVEAFNFNLQAAVDFIILNNNKENIFLHLEGIQFKLLRKIYKFFFNKLRKYNIQILGFKIVNLISHGGCKK